MIISAALLYKLPPEPSLTCNIASGVVVLIPVFPFFKTVMAFFLELFERPFPIAKTGSVNSQVLVEVDVVSLNCPIANKVKDLALTSFPEAIALIPIALVEFPKETALLPIAKVDDPVANVLLPDALVELPIVVD